MNDRRAAASFAWAETVGPDWVDYNGHMGDFAYAIAFSQTVTAYMEFIGLDEAYREKTAATLYTLDLRIGYRRECHEGTALQLTLHVLAADAKRVHLYLEMHDAEGTLLAWNEQVLLHVTRASGTPKASSFPDVTRAHLANGVSAASAILPIPHTARPIGLGR